MEYNYKEAVKSDVRDWMADNEQEWKSVHLWDLATWLSDVLFCEDSVTGNESGSYTMSRYEARQNFFSDPDADDYITEMVEDGILEEQTLGEWVASQNWEAIDVCIRCHLLDGVCHDIVSEML